MSLTHFRFLLLFGFMGAVLSAQTSGTGALTGTVSDTSGAVIPNALVELKNADTGQARTANTGSDGTYRFALIPPGTYAVKFSANGFKTAEVPRIAVAVTETPVLDQKLEVGTQTEQITVDATVEAVQTSNATLGTVLGSSQVAALPLTTRNYTNILGLSSGVSASVTTAATLGKAGMDMSVNGAEPGQNNIQIDGAPVVSFAGYGKNSDTFGTYSTTAVPNPDSLQEFKVQTSLYDAGYGRNAGANVNAVTKSGTNTFHGTAFEFFRNTVLNANDFFLNLNGKKKGVLNQNQYGGTLGGPIRKDKLFFFASYQGTHQDNGLAAQGNSAVTLPPIPGGDRSNTALFQAAVGAAFCPANHPGSTLYNTLHGGVQIACDGSNVNPIAMNLLQAKNPNGAYVVPGSGISGFLNSNFSLPAISKEYQWLGNADYILSSKHTLALRAFVSDAPSLISFQGLTNGLPGFGANQLYRNTTALAKLTSVLSGSLVNEARISMHRDVAVATGVGTFSDKQFGIAATSPYLDATLPGFLSVESITGIFSIGAGANGNDYTNSASTAYQATDQISWSHGKQTIRAGFELEQIRWDWNYLGLGKSTFTFSTFNDWLVGLPGCAPPATTCSTPGTNGSAFSNIASTHGDAMGPSGVPKGLWVWDVASFIQDDVKISQRLTLNVGVRYEYDGFTKDIYGYQVGLWPSAILSVPNPGNSPTTGSIAGWVVPHNYPGPLLPGLTRASNDSALTSLPPKDNFAPRIGFAWQPVGGNKLVVRGGYGFFFDRVAGGNYTTAVSNAPPAAPKVDKTGQANYFASFAVPWIITPDPTVPNGTVPNSFPVRWVNFAAQTSSSLTVPSFGPGWITPLIQSWNIGIQYQLAPSWILEVGYVGSHGIHLQDNTTLNINQALLATAAAPINGVTTNTVANAVLRVPYLGFGAITDGCSCFDSKYNSLQSTLRKQFSHGVQAQASYTWAKALTDMNTTQDFVHLQDNYGPDTAYHPQRVTINYAWNLPFGNPKGVLGVLAKGWNLSGVTTIQDGTPLTLTDGRGGTAYGLASSRAQLLAGVKYSQIATPGGVQARLGGNTGGCGYFTSPSSAGNLNGTSCASLTAFTAPPLAVAPDGTVSNGTGWGTSGVGVILGPGQFNFDVSASKVTRVGGLHEDATVQFRAEFFNTFNHPQFGNPVTTASTATFGQITTTTVNPRVIQLALKYVF